MDSGISIRVAGYKPTDLESFLLSYCLTHPSTVVELPEISSAIYPNSGGSRVLEFHFSYLSSKAEMRTMQQTVSTMLSSVSSFTGKAADELHRLDLLGEYLVSRTRESAAGHACAYNLLCKQEADSRGFASVVYYISEQAGAECYLVCGSKNGVPHFWNIIAINGEYRHVDMMEQWLQGKKSVQLMTDDEMVGCEWNRSLLPACTAPEPEPDEPDAEDAESATGDETGSSAISETLAPSEATAPDEPEQEPSGEASDENGTEQE